jgi:hypothetical protein
MHNYPYSSPIILSDSIFNLYGGHTGSSVAAQRQAAYFISEIAVSDDINTLLLPTIVTGTYLYNPLHKFILDHGYVTKIIQTKYICQDEDVFYTVAGTANNYVTLEDGEYGIAIINGSCSICGSSLAYPYKVQFVYEAGLPSGTSYRPDILLGLVTYADIILNEIQGYGNEAPGDIGVQDYKNQQYSESRVALIRTVFGTSARAQFVHRLLTKYRHHRWVGL